MVKEEKGDLLKNIKLIQKFKGGRFPAKTDQKKD